MTQAHSAMTMPYIDYGSVLEIGGQRYRVVKPNKVNLVIETTDRQMKQVRRNTLSAQHVLPLGTVWEYSTAEPEPTPVQRLMLGQAVRYVGPKTNRKHPDRSVKWVVTKEISENRYRIIMLGGNSADPLAYWTVSAANLEVVEVDNKV